MAKSKSAKSRKSQQFWTNFTNDSAVYCVDDPLSWVFYFTSFRPDQDVFGFGLVDCLAQEII